MKYRGNIESIGYIIKLNFLYKMKLQKVSGTWAFV